MLAQKGRELQQGSIEDIGKVHVGLGNQLSELNQKLWEKRKGKRD